MSAQSGAEPVACVREVLEPFARAADRLEKCRDDRPLWAALDAGWAQREAIHLTVGDLRRVRALYTAPPRPDVSAGLIEAACLLDKRADEYVNANKPIEQGYRMAARFLRVRAADRSAK